MSFLFSEPVLPAPKMQTIPGNFDHRNISLIKEEGGRGKDGSLINYQRWLLNHREREAM